MGCDIHGWVEKKVNNKWIAYKELRDRDRNYERFGKLAGVRRDGPEPKGIPEDVSETTQLHIDEWDSDGHSHSSLPLVKAFLIFQETSGNEYYSQWTAFGVDQDEMDDFRLVFWFDN